MKHKHHIIPKHMGGTDEPENLVELTVDDHAEAHKILYEKYGHWQDYVAWKGLLGLLTSDECTIIAIREGAKKGGQIGNQIRWKNHIPKEKKYPAGVDGRKVRTSRYWFNNGETEGQYSLEDYPEGWSRGRLKSVMKKTRGENASL